MPEMLWQVAEGHVAYTLPLCSAYQIGSSRVAQVPALAELRGELWGVMLAAIPQVVPADDGTQGGCGVLVELECVAQEAELGAPEHDAEDEAN